MRIKQFIPKAISILIIILLGVLSAKAQVPNRPGNVTGPGQVQQGTSATYRVTASSNANSYRWTVNPSNAGTVSGGTTSAVVTWSATYLGFAGVQCTAYNSSGSTDALGASVNVIGAQSPLYLGPVTPSGTTINSGTDGGTLKADGAGGGAGNYTYQWQRSPDNSSWVDIAGATGLSCNVGRLDVTTYFSLVVTSGTQSTSSTAIIFVYTPLKGGSIDPAFSTINFNGSVTLTAQPATGASGSNYTYQWTTSTDGINFTPIFNATGLVYETPALKVYTFYRLISTNNSEHAVSSAYVTVYPQLIAGRSADNQTINYGASTTLTGIEATGGNGTITYQWQVANGNTWTNVPTAGRSFSTGELTANTSYRLVSSSAGVDVISNTVTVSVYPRLTAGAITPLYQNAFYNTTSDIKSGMPTGGNGVYTYQWLISENNGDFVNIDGATDLVLRTKSLIASTSYRLMITSNDVTIASNTATVNVFAPFTGGTIDPANATIGYGDKVKFKSSLPTGGGGGYSYQWTSATDGINFTPIFNATDLIYETGALTVDTYYRLVYKTGSLTTISSASVKVYPQLVSGIVSGDQTIGYGTAPTIAIKSGSPAGGSGTYSYQWQNFDGSDWTDVPLATDLTFPATALTSTTLYRLITKSSTLTVTSNSITVTVGTQLVAGKLNYSSLTVVSNTAVSKLTVDPATGGVGNYDYKWETSLDGTSWTSAGTSGLSFTPPDLTLTTYYRNAVKSDQTIAYSNVCIITVISASSPVAPGHTVKLSYTANNIAVSDTAHNTSVQVYRVAINNDYTRTLVKGTLDDGHYADYYRPGKLLVTVIKNENLPADKGRGGSTEEYKDKDGRVVLKRVFNYVSPQEGLQMLSTYYVYDGSGNLSFVLPPGSNADAGNVDATALDLYCYQYRYDNRNRLIEKKIPGRGWEYIVYNKLDQVVLTQDANQFNKPSQEFIFMRYDALGRPVMTGTYRYDATPGGLYVRPIIQSRFDTQPYLWEERANTGTGYTSRTLPDAESAIYNYLTFNYYDDYSFPGGSTYPYAAGSSRTRGLLTGTKTLVLGTNDMLLTVNYYDDKGRLIKIYKQHYQSGNVNAGNYDETSYSYNFENIQTASTRIHHNVVVGNITIADRYVYDHMDRKLESYEKINTDAEVLLAKNNYNEVGQLKGEDLDNKLQHTNYTYNERGWLKNSSSAQFSFQLNYEDGITPQYNGNISGQLWGAGGVLNNNFVYSYDHADRLKSGVATGMSEVITYDQMGNIKNLKRNDTTRNYNYAGNQLINTTGGPETASYQYDFNGNAKVDGRNGQTITYNALNLPAAIPGLNLSYIYDAKGDKLRKVSGSKITDYVDGIQYTNGLIDFIQTEVGLARRNGAGYSYEYDLEDHLGNVRYSFHNSPVTGQIERLQSDDYYPFGLRKPSGSLVSLNNKYLYNGKELQEELGDYDYGARFYDPAIGRWNVTDPNAEDYEYTSPYNYVLNNPISNTDPDGTSVNDGLQNLILTSTVVDGTGKIIDHKNDGDNSVYQQLLDGSRIKIGTEKNDLDYDKLIGQQLNPLIYDPNPIDLKELVVTAKKKPKSALEAIGVGLVLRTSGGWLGAGTDPEPFTKLIGAVAVTAYSAYVIADEATQYYHQIKKAEAWEGLLSGGAEHKKGARKSTKAKHQKGLSSKKKARGGEKGESLPPRKRPNGWVGSWPPK